MKRLIALLTALLVLCSGLSVFAESGERAEKDAVYDTVEIEERMVTDDSRMSAGTLAENIRLFLDLLESEDVRSLLKIDDVKDVLGEIVARTIIWLWQNRPVTMKILAELGVPEEEREAISVIWDSAERMEKQELAYLKTDEGKAFLRDLEELRKLPAFNRLLQEYTAMVKARDVNDFFSILRRVGDKNLAVPPSLTPEDLKQLAESYGYQVTGVDAREMSDILAWMYQYTGVADSLAELAGEPVFWRVFFNLYERHLNPEDGILAEEIAGLLDNSKVRDYLSRLVETAAATLHALREKELSLNNQTKDAPASETEVAP